MQRIKWELSACIIAVFFAILMVGITGCGRDQEPVIAVLPSVRASVYFVMADDTAVAVKLPNENHWWYVNLKTKERGNGYSYGQIIERFQ